METTIAKKILIGISLISTGVFANAQNGLEKIIVEKYYVSNKADATGSVGILSAGSVTYRIYVDMLPGYTFKMAYGDVNHLLSIKTSTTFFNNEDRGNTNPSYTKNQARNNTVMLDSWLSAGAACAGNFGILKSEDDSIATVENADGILQNNDITAGIPLTIQDGLIAGSPGAFGIIGIDSEVQVFDATSQTGNSFSTNDGAWYCLDGAVGPTAENKVLIAQLTTDGQLSFELNIQIGTPLGSVEKYVAKNPLLWDGIQEIQLPSLTYKSEEGSGLENVIVEKYYVSNAADANASIGALPAGSVTYRVYADLLQGYKFQKAYGTSEHPLSINTTTSFFNNEDKGNTNPTYTKEQAANNTVMLDSWLSAGAACSGNYGILKSDDNGTDNVVNSTGILQNADTSAGIPLTTKDGFAAGSPGIFGSEGIDSEISVFGSASQAGNSFTTTNGAWFCQEGAVGANSNNQVLIAQLTTNGRLSFELNLQILTPVGDTQFFVAKNPLEPETFNKSLTYVSPPITSINSEFNNNLLQFSVYPNPASDVISLSINQENTNSESYYTIYDIIGNVLLSKKIIAVSENYKESIDLSSYSIGVYFIEVSINGKSSTRKIIKN